VVQGKGKKGRPAHRVRTEFADEWIVTAHPQVFINKRRTDRILTAEQFNTTVRPFSDVEDTARLLIHHHSCHADGLEYLPGEPAGVVVVDKRRVMNTYRPGHIREKAGSIQPFNEYMIHLVPDEGDRHELSRWCATLIARPDIRMHYGVLLISETQGVGKSTLGEAILAPLIGLDNVSFPTEQAILKSDFNYWIAHKRLAIIQEIFSGQNKKVYDNLKSTMTDRYVDVNKKNIPNYRLRNYVQVLASSSKS
jgi:hypothetical protein